MFNIFFLNRGRHTGPVGREVKLIRLLSDSIADRGHISLIIDRYYANCTDK